MFRNLLTRLLVEKPDTGTLARDDADLALAALLVRAARDDGHYSERDQHLIDRLFAYRNGTSCDEAGDRRTAAEMIEAEIPDTAILAQRVRNCVPPESRAAVIAAMWRVADARGARDSREEALICAVAHMAGLDCVTAVDPDLAANGPDPIMPVERFRESG